MNTISRMLLAIATLIVLSESALAQKRPCPTPAHDGKPPLEPGFAVGARTSTWLRQTGAKTVVVFIHGFNSSGASAFLCRFVTAKAPDSTYFPNLVLADNSLFGAPVDLAVLEWWTGWDTPGYSLSRAASDMAQELVNGLPDGRPPIINPSTENVVFVTHSTGGVLITRVLATTPAFRSLNVGLFLMASPGRGAFTQFDSLTYIGTFKQTVMTLFERYSTSSQVVDLLKGSSGFLHDTHQKFLAAWRPVSRGAADGRPPVLVHELCESQPLMKTGWFDTKMQLVPPISCSLYTADGSEVVPDADHFEVAKPRDRTAPTFSRFSWFAKAFIDSILTARQLRIRGFLRTSRLSSGIEWRHVDFAPGCVSQSALVVASIDDDAIAAPLATVQAGTASVANQDNGLGSWTLTPKFAQQTVANMSTAAVRITMQYTPIAGQLQCTPVGAALNSGFALPAVRFKYPVLMQSWQPVDSIAPEVAFATRLSANDASWQAECPWPADARFDDPSVNCTVALDIEGRLFDYSQISGLRVESANPSKSGFQLLVSGKQVRLLIPRKLP